jgi:1-acyl-sn-glycerol-3-phosphate acyltransferase
MSAAINHYHRRRLIQTVGRVLQALLARVTVTGRENIPKQGPLIVVGNHVGYAEPALMITTMPFPIELLAAGDIPLRSRFLFLQKMYGYLSVNRGEIDREALKSISTILTAGGSIGIFPEGGVWDRKIGDARMGVAYISQQTQAPLLPIGFGGVVGALDNVVKLKRPKITVNVGKVIPPVATSENYRERKALAQAASNQIMQAIYDLVPPDDEINTQGSRDEQFHFEVETLTPSGVAVPLPREIPNGDELALLFHRPILLSVVIDNMQRADAEPLRHLETERDPAKLTRALDAALKVYAEEKPVFLGYRLGYQRADRIVNAMRALREVTHWAAEAGYTVNLMPGATFTYADGEVEQVKYPGAGHKID